MARCAAFLRAINVGGHTVTMAHLKRVLTAAGLRGVETLLASGNVILEMPRGSTPAALATRMRSALEAALGFDVATFVRTRAELEAIVSRGPFTADAGSGRKVYVSFLADRPRPAAVARLVAEAPPGDTYAVQGREFFWLRTMGRPGDFDPPPVEKVLGLEATMRGMPTVERALARLG